MRELEFLPEEYLRARFQRRIGFIRSWLLLAIGLAMVLWSFRMGAWVRDARAELQALRGTGSAVEADVAKIQMLRTEARAYHRRLDLMRRLRPPVTVAEAVGDAVGALPAEVVLDGLDVEESTEGDADGLVVRFRGLAPDELVVTRTVGLLEASPRFEHVVLVESKRPAGRPNGWRTFVVEAGVARAAPGREH